jgi:nucleotide-binding universal stress UspA family protein
MALRIIVSYDDTDNDRDALALGRLLAFSGADLSLAYVRHAEGGALEEKEAEDLLAHGAESVGAPEMTRHVVVNPSTSEGLAELAQGEAADAIVFGSEYRTAPGTVAPGRSAHKLLLGGPAAIAVAPESLATALGATVVEHGKGPCGFLVIGSRPESPKGKVTLSAASDYEMETSTCPVLIVPRGTPLSFAAVQAQAV